MGRGPLATSQLLLKSVIDPSAREFFDDRRVFDTGDDLNLTTTLTAAFNIDIKNPFQSPGAFNLTANDTTLAVLLRVCESG